MLGVSTSSDDSLSSSGSSFVARTFGGGTPAPSNSEDNRAFLVRVLLLLCLALGLYGSVTSGVAGKGRRASACCTGEQQYFECAVWQDARSLAAFAVGIMLCTCLSPQQPELGGLAEEDSSPVTRSQPGQYRRDDGALADKLRLYSYAM